LRALAREAEQTPNASIRKGKSGSIVRNSNRSPQTNQRLDKDEILERIRSSTFFNNVQSLIAYGKSSGLKVNVSAKDSKERIARRLANAIERAPGARRSEILSELSRAQDKQTQGWIDVIKNTQQ
jgi:hypothetical protein